MEFFPAPLENLVEQFARLPGIGSKSAQRLAFHVLNLPQDQARAFADAILEAKRSVTLCPVCQNLTHLPQPDRRGALPHLRLAQAGREHHLRGGGPPGRGGHRAQPGV